MEAPERDAGALKRLMRDLPLFSGVGPDNLQALDFEVDLFCGAARITEGPSRPSYFRVDACRPGQTLVCQGDLTTDLLVLLDGFASSYWASPGRPLELVETCGAGDWLGETSALSHTPSLTTLRADTASEAAVLDHRFFMKLYREEDAFRERVERRYREKSLPLHLRSSPLFAGLAREDLEEVRREAELVSFLELDGGEEVAARGAEAEAFYLVRSGAVKCSVKEEDDGERILAYYMGNSSFGEHVIATADRTWPGDYTTLARTDLVKIPREAFERIRKRRPEVHRVLTSAANLILGGDGGAGGLEKPRRRKMAREEIDVMVRRQSVKGGDALVIDKEKCIRCNACVEACVSVHDDRVPRLSKVGAQVSGRDVLITACYHCAVPDCMAACNYGAIRRDAEGEVVFIYENCVGCSACVIACPYDVVRMTNPLANEEARRRGGLLARGLDLLAGLPLLGGLLGRKAAQGAVSASAECAGGELGKVTNYGKDDFERSSNVTGKAVKCDYCAGLPFEACVYNCPTFAIRRRRPEELFRT